MEEHGKGTERLWTQWTESMDMDTVDEVDIVDGKDKWTSKAMANKVEK